MLLLYVVLENVVISLFYMWLSSVPSTPYWTDYPFSILCSCPFVIGSLTVSEILPHSYPQWLHQSIFSPTVYESSISYTHIHVAQYIKRRHDFISELSIPFHWFTCLFLCQYNTVWMTIALQYRWKSGSVSPQLCVSFLRFFPLFCIFFISI